MPHFFLNIHNGSGAAPDDEGMELPDLEAARQKAIEGVRSILSEEIKAGALDLQGRIEIADQEGQILAKVPFSDAVRILLPDGPSQKPGGER